MIKYFITKKDIICGISVARLDEDGILTWLGDGQEDAEYLAWVAEGNVAEEWNPNGN